ncbi:hypothetical protein Fmac_005266 [Flemingia macrophylla]|uniref:Uncharacterized protein n=1 Tax=Flemingia macrophylla TaxID=520843 RepID=A0ABD1N7U9_9FABA
MKERKKKKMSLKRKVGVTVSIDDGVDAEGVGGVKAAKDQEGGWIMEETRVVELLIWWRRRREL